MARITTINKTQPAIEKKQLLQAAFSRNAVYIHCKIFDKIIAANGTFGDRLFMACHSRFPFLSAVTELDW